MRNSCAATVSLQSLVCSICAIPQTFKRSDAQIPNLRCRCAIGFLQQLLVPRQRGSFFLFRSVSKCQHACGCKPRWAAMASTVVVVAMEIQILIGMRIGIGTGIGIGIAMHLHLPLHSHYLVLVLSRDGCSPHRARHSNHAPAP